MFHLPSSRRSFLKTTVASAGAIASGTNLIQAQQSVERPLLAYVGTFSSPLRDTLPTQVDLPPGNGRGIHYFQVDRDSGELQPAGTYRMGTSPSCLVVSM